MMKVQSGGNCKQLKTSFLCSAFHSGSLVNKSCGLFYALILRALYILNILLAISSDSYIPPES